MLENIEQIGKRIKNGREELGMKQQVLASEAKIDSASLSRYENGRQEPNLETLVKIAQVLNLSLDYLVFGEKKERIFSKTGEEEKAHAWNEAVCYALATLIETETITIQPDTTSEGFLKIDFEKNPSVLEFFDKLMKFNELRRSLSEDLYESAKNSLINEYQQKIYNSNSALNNYVCYHDYHSIDDNNKLCDNLLKQILKNHRKLI